METYTVEIGEESLKLISRALDFYSRVGSGQFKEILDHPSFEKSVQDRFTSKDIPKVGDKSKYGKVIEINKDTFKCEDNWGNGLEIKEFPIEMLKFGVDYSLYHDYRDQVLNILTNARNMLIFDILNTYSHPGLYNKIVDDTCRQAFDIHQIIRHEFWKKDLYKSNMTVDSSICFSSNEGVNFKIIQ